MKDVALVHSTFWTGETGLAIRGNADAQRVALYAITSPASDSTGMYAISTKAISHDVGISEPAVKKAMTLLTDLGFLKYSEEWSWLWVVEMLRFQMGDSMRRTDNRVLALQKFVDRHAKYPFIEEFCAKYGPTHCIVYHPVTAKPASVIFDKHDGERPEDARRTKAAERGKQVREVFEYYRGFYPLRHRVVNSTMKEWKMISARLDEGITVEDLCRAIDGMRRSEWHQGKNPQNKPYDSIGYAMRDHKQVDAMLAMPTHVVHLGDKNRASVDAVRARAEKRAAKAGPPPSSAEPESFGEFLEGDGDAAYR